MKYIKRTIVDAYKITKYNLFDIYWDLNAPQWLLEAIDEDVIYEKGDKIFFFFFYSVGRLLNKNDYLIFEDREIFKLDEKSFEEQFERYYAWLFINNMI